MSNKWCLAIDSNTKYVTLNWYFLAKKKFEARLESLFGAWNEVLASLSVFFLPSKT